MSERRTIGTKSPFVIAIDLCFQLALDRRVVPADFARDHNIDRDTVTKYLKNLRSRFRLALERDKGEGGLMEWSLAHPSFPGGVCLKADEARALRSLLKQLPRGIDRDRFLWLLTRGLDPDRVRAARPSSIEPNASGAERLQRMLFQSYDERRVLRAHYHATRDGSIGDRDISVHDIVVDRVTRFVGSERGGERLRWFRLSNVQRAEIVDDVGFEPQADDDVRRFIRESYDGFHDGKPPRECVFEVVFPEARWVPQNLAVQPSVTPRGHCVVLTVVTSGVQGLARDVVGLGAAARAITPELREHVHRLATGAIGARNDGGHTADHKTARVRSRPARG